MINLTPTIRLYDRADWGARPWRGFTNQGFSGHQAFLHHGAEAHAERIDTLAEQKQAMRDIQALHMNKADPMHGWSDIGYHFVVFQSEHAGVHARIFRGRPRNHVPAAQLGHNMGTLAICVYGDFTPGHDELKDNTIYALEVLLRRYHKHLVTLGGHRDVTPTSCPGDNIYKMIPHIADAVDLSVYKR